MSGPRLVERSGYSVELPVPESPDGEYSVEMRDRLADTVKAGVRSKMDMNGGTDDEKVFSYIDDVMRQEKEISALPISTKQEIRKQVFDFFRRMDILQELLEDEAVTEIMVNGTESVYYEKNGRLRLWNRRFTSKARLEDLIQKIVSDVNRAVNTASPIVDARLGDGSRINVALPPAAPDGPILTIRRFPKDSLTFERLVEYESITEEAADFLRELVVGGYNIFISGGTGSGKTTFLNALSRNIPADERVVTIEDSLELQLPIANLVRLEVRNENLQGRGEIGIRELIRTALRMRPDRLIVGEIRGPEALDMLQAMNTGHDGSLSTGHGNSAKDMLSRIETMVLMGGELPLQAVRSQMSSALDVMIHLERLRGGRRRVADISEVAGIYEGEIRLRTIFGRTEDGRLQRLAKPERRRGH